MDSLLLTIIAVAFLYWLYKKNNITKEQINYPVTKNTDDEYFEPVQSIDMSGQITHTVKHQNPDDVKVSGRKKGKLYCPKCKSINCEILDNSKKGFSLGKAVAGSVIAPTGGALIGFTGKRNKKPTFRCRSCGQVFQHKIK